MPHPRLLILCAAILVGGCGSASGSGSASSAATAPASAPTPTTATTPTVDSSSLKRLPQAPAPGDRRPISPGTSRGAFLRAVFDDAAALWRREFRGAGATYRAARLTIFSQQVRTACGDFGAEVGPFYCPASFGVYLDPTFFAALSRRSA